MTHLMDIKQARWMAIALVTAFLGIHILLFFIFKREGVTPMVYFNMFSICFYLGMYYIALNRMFRTYTALVYLEVLVHMSAAVYFTGWESGFQNTLIGMNILLLYAEYIGRYFRIPYLKSMRFAFLGMGCYLASCVVDHSRPAPYPLSPEVAFWFQLFWGVVVFITVLIFLMIFVQVSAGSEELLSMEANHDQLTGLANRYYVMDCLGKIRDGVGLEEHWVAIMDIDDFKRINDTYGHDCGDYILREFASLLKKREGQMQVSRWGGEEFLLFGEIKEGMDAHWRELDELRKEIMNYPFSYEMVSLQVTVTIGLASFVTGSTIRDWVNTADQRLYNGKLNGKNRVVAS